jgi:predicted exporter
MTRWGRIRVLLGALVAAALAVFVAARFEVTNDITHFIPAGADPRAVEIARQLGQSELARTMTFTVEGPDRATAAAGARALAAELRQNPEISWVSSGGGDAVDKAVYDLYFPRRLAFLSARPERDLPERLTAPGLREAARGLRSALERPAAIMVRPLAPEDPLLAFAGHLDRLRAPAAGALTLDDGQLVTADGRHGVVFAGTRPSPFDQPRQTALLAGIDAAFARVDAAHGGVLRLESSGVNRFVVASDRSVRADVQRVSTLSMVGIVALFLLVFRSVRYVLLGMVPLAMGTLCAMAVGLLLFGRLHGITIAFGSSLIGTGIDYAEHYFTHHTLAPDPRGPEASLSRLWPGLALGACTTIAGLAGLAWTSFPGVREIAVFSSVGIAAALLSTRWLLPPLTPRRPKPVRLAQRLAAALSRVPAAMVRGRRLLVVLPLAAVALCAVGLPRVRWIDDVSALDSVDPILAGEDRRVRARVADSDAGRFVVALGADEEQALANNDAAALRLEEARRDGLLTGFRSLHAWLRSAALQAKSDRAIRADAGLPARLRAAFEAEGFVDGAFDPFLNALAQQPPPPLTFEMLARSPLSDMVRPFRVDLRERIAIVTPLSGVRDARALAARFAGSKDVIYVDQRALLDEAYGAFRVRTFEMICAGLFLVFLMVHVRYRRLRLSLAAFLPALLAAGVTVSVLALAGVGLNLMHLVGVLLVLSMGVDYGVFVVESREHPEELGATLLSLVVAMFTTVLSFGLLALSQHPALRALGLVSGVGVALSMLLAPAALSLLRATKEPA